MDFFVFDDDYIRRLREGDRATVEHFVRYFTRFFTLKLRGRLPANLEIKEIIQEVFVRILSGLRQGRTVRDSHAFGSYVNSIGNHVVQEGLHRHQTEPLDLNIPSPDDLFRDFETAENKEIVHRYLERLERRDKRSADILRDVFLDQLDKDAICSRHGTERSYLRVLVHRALKKLREMLAEE